MGSSYQRTFPYQDSRASEWPIQNQQWSLTVLCASRHRLFKDANTGKAAWELQQQLLWSSMASKLLAPLGNSLRPCAVPRVKSSLHLGDIGTQVERREQHYSLQSCSALPDSRCSGLDANERAVSRMAAGLGKLYLLSGNSLAHSIHWLVRALDGMGYLKKRWTHSASVSSPGSCELICMINICEVRTLCRW